MRQAHWAAAIALVLAAVLGATTAGAASDPFIDALPVGGAGVGYLLRFERSTYRGSEGAAEQLPLYLYEGQHAYLHGTRLGLKASAGDWRFDTFIAYRFEGFTQDKVPSVAAGLPAREPGYDAGFSVRRRTGWGTPYVEFLHDVSRSSNGTELRAGYWANEWRRGGLTLKPQLVLAWRDSSLNNHYYGTPDYQAGAGLDAQAAVYASYALTESWNLLAWLSATRRSHEITASPLARAGLQSEAFVGFLYDFSPKQNRWAPESRPTIVKVLYGNSSDCDMLQVVRLSCTTRHTVDNTDVAAVHVGRKLIERAGGWPIDLAGFVGVQRHFEKSYQDDFWSVMAFFKVYWYGFGWERWGLHTRLGMGSGLSYAEQIPEMELHDQGRRGRGNWKLLNYLDPSFDVRVARDTYVGVGVSHRSGAFGKSQFFGNVNGGSNYIYFSVESSF
ncbi:MAG TPA: MipA/OmpV family protein [Burkholderiales bacterium]|nr:MipA/OmpV family protein [Burkholderiales bacterium]